MRLALLDHRQRVATEAPPRLQAANGPRWPKLTLNEEKIRLLRVWHSSFNLLGNIFYRDAAPAKMRHSVPCTICSKHVVPSAPSKFTLPFSRPIRILSRCCR
jgi:hypothetical protein